MKKRSKNSSAKSNLNLLHHIFMAGCLQSRMWLGVWIDLKYGCQHTYMPWQYYLLSRFK